MIRLSLVSTNAFSLLGEDDLRLDGNPIEDVRETLGIEQDFLDEEIVQPEDGRQ